MKSRNSVKKRPERTDEHADVHPGRMKHPPSRRREIAGERGRNNDETLIPHTRIRKLDDDPDPNQVRAKILEPEKLRRHDVAEHHAEIRPPIRARRTIQERRPLDKGSRCTTP